MLGKMMENVVSCGSDVRERIQLEPPSFSRICLPPHSPRPSPSDRVRMRELSIRRFRDVEVPQREPAPAPSYLGDGASG